MVKMPLPIKNILMLTALAAFAALPARALEWQPFGARSMAMGGTGVALAKGPTGSYWNPAGLAQEENASGGVVAIGAQAAVTGELLTGANDLYNTAMACKNGDIFQCNSTNINKALGELSGPGSGVTLNAPVALLDMKIKGFAFFVHDFTYVGLSPYVDTWHEGVISNSPQFIGKNISGLAGSALSVAEVGVGYAHKVHWDGLYVGGNLKALVGATGYDQMNAAQAQTNGFPTPNSSNYDLQYKQIQPGVDLGILWDVTETFPGAILHPRIGVTGRNLNNPKFNQPTAAQMPVCQPVGNVLTTNCVMIGQPGRISLGAQTRAGVAISPWHWLNVTADVDLVKNSTLLHGYYPVAHNQTDNPGSAGTWTYYSQMVGAGLEANIFNRTWINIPLRVGIENNLASAKSPAVVTAGVGFNLLHLTIDIGAEVTPKLQTVPIPNKDSSKAAQTMDLPSEVGLMLQLGFQFGGAKKDKTQIEG